MDTSTGQLYDSRWHALAAGVAEENLVLLQGAPEAVEQISRAVSAQYRAERKAKNKAAKRSRRANRKG